LDERYLNEVPLDVRNICDGYAAGINKYAKDNPRYIFKKLYPLKGVDIIAGFMHRTPLFYGMGGMLNKLLQSKPPTLIGHKANDEKGVMQMHASNVFAVSPKRSTDGYTRLMVNSHQPWSGPVAWYEAHISSDEGWDIITGLFPGSPVGLVGHNPDLGWSHTVNDPDLIDVFRLTINPDNDNQYLFDGEWLDLSIKKIKIKVKIFGLFYWKVKRGLYNSILGPVLKTDHGTYAIRYASMGDVRLVEQWYRMNRSRNLSEFKEAMSIHAIPMFNTGYADKAGNIYYVYNAKIPKRHPDLDWKQVVPGDKSIYLWNEYIPYEDLPQIENPPGGFIYSCNNTPYLCTDNPKDFPDRLPENTGIDTHQTNRALRALELFGQDKNISREEFLAYKYDKQYSKNSHVAKVLEKFLLDSKNISNDLKPAVDLLKNWNLSAEQENKAAALGFLTFRHIGFNPEEYTYNYDKIINKMKEGIQFLTENYGSIDIPLGSVQRLKHGTADLPLGGGPDMLRAIYTRNDGNIMKGVAGDCYIQFIEWDTEGNIYSESIHQFGASTSVVDSKHYDDQAKLFSKEMMKPIRKK
ncbi:MAG: penicillin acylase family protein, partial [Candidatus Marinimicrobia bacterium]|nr:penicillin acylase family protein [Candidatus Neomarinimicrobiota bacterium]